MLKRKGSRRRDIAIFTGLLLILSGAVLWRLLAGDMEIPARGTLLYAVGLDGGLTTQQELAVGAVRLPRLLSSMGAGAALSVSGVVLQGILVNPLAEPYTLGIASGAALGASVGIMLGARSYPRRHSQARCPPSSSRCCSPGARAVCRRCI